MCAAPGMSDKEAMTAAWKDAGNLHQVGDPSRFGVLLCSPHARCFDSCKTQAM